MRRALARHRAFGIGRASSVVAQLIAPNTQAAVALKSATASIPIVFVAVGDPVSLGLVQSLSRPGGNITGLATLVPGFTSKEIEILRELVPTASKIVILAHPECSPEVVGASDFSGSTTAMIKYVEKTNAPRYLLLTECSMGDNIAAANPEKEMLRLCSVRCPHMNQITLEDTLESLRKEQFEIVIDEDIRRRALRSVERMLEIGTED